MIRPLAIAAAIAAATVGVAPTATADPMADLTRMLPAGYSGDSCRPAERAGALAAVNCRDNALPGGPTSATYWLFGDRNAMNDAFTAYLNSPARAAAACPGMTSSDPIALVGADGTRYGSIACGRASTTDFQDRDGSVAWTREADQFLGVAYVGYQGQAYPASLFNWVKVQSAQTDCEGVDGAYTTWIGDAGIAYSSCCYEDAHGSTFCDDYVDGDYQGTSPQAVRPPVTGQSVSPPPSPAVPAQPQARPAQSGASNG